MRQRTGRKRLCFLLPFALMLVLVMAVSAAAWAEPASAHTHTLGENTITFDPWESTNSLPYSEGSYYLTDNVTLSEQWQPASGTTNLCLNGHAIIFDKEDSERIDVICVANGTTLNLFDETANAGTITHAAGEGKCPGRGVFVYGGTFTVYGGTITGNNAAGDGGGVYVRSGTFNLSGGTVTGNNAGGDGGGVFLSDDGILTVSGGSITGNNTGKSGGGVEVCGGTFNLSGGSITGNNAGTYGGGVEVYGGTFNLSGGSITGNNAGGDGGGVYMNRLRFNISGSPTITDNVKGGRIDTGSGVYVKGDNGIDSNVYLNNAASKKVINVVGTLTNTRPVGVTMAQPGVFTKSSDPVKASDYYDKFASDSSDYAVAKSGNELTLTQIIAYPLYVSGTQVTNANQYDVLGDADEGATVVYTPADNSTTPATPATLTLSGANITTGYEVKGSTAAIYTTDDLIVTGSGSVRNVGFGIHIEGGKTLTLNGDFDLTATVNGIYLFGNSKLVMKDGAVNTTGGTNGVFAPLNGSSVTIDGGTLTAIGNGAQNKVGYGLSLSGTLTVNGGMVFATGGTNGAPGHGIGVDPDAQASQIVINGGAVTATGARSALNKAPTVAEGITAFGSASSDGEPAETYDAAKNSDYKWVRTQIDYPLWVGGTQVTSANRNDVLGDADDGATVVFTPADSGAATLTLSGARITDGYTFGMSDSAAAIYADGDLTINVTAASTVRGPDTVSGDSYGVYSSSGSVTVTGTGELNAAGGEATNGNSCGVWAFGDVTVAAGKLTATGGTQGISGNVKNAIAGTGWTDVDGTQGEAAIAVSATGQDLSSYKKVQFPAVYPLWVGGTQVTSANQDDVLGDADQGATVTFAPADGADPATLTLTGANITTGHKAGEWMNGIYYGGTNDLKLVLVGENKISGEDLDYGINNEGNDFKGRGALTVTGEGKLDVIGKYYGITSAKVLTIENATVYASATGRYPVCIQGTEGIVISNSTVKTTGENGIASNGSVVIKAGSNVMAAAQVYGIYSKPENNGSVVIEDGACVIASGNQLSAIVGNVKNAIAGIGWEDAFGVTGKENIAVNTDPGGDLSKYRKVMFLAKPLITGADLVLDGTLDFRFYVALPENADPTGAYMSLTVHGRTIEIPFSEAEVSMEGATQGQTIFPCPVYSIEMMEPVTAVFHYTQDGQAKTATLTASIKDYLDIAQKTYPAHPQLQDLIAAVRDYGHYIQLYLARLHGFTVGEGGEYAAMPAATEDLKPATALDLEPYKTKWYRSNTGILDSVSYYNTFAECTTLHVRVKLKSARTLTATVNDKSWEITSLGGNEYDIEIPNIAANNLDEEYKVVFTADGVLVCDIGVSALTYVSAVLASDRDEADEKAALTAFYNYYKAAEACSN